MISTFFCLLCFTTSSIARADYLRSDSVASAQRPTRLERQRRLLLEQKTYGEFLEGVDWHEFTQKLQTAADLAVAATNSRQIINKHKTDVISLLKNPTDRSACSRILFSTEGRLIAAVADKLDILISVIVQGDISGGKYISASTSCGIAIHFGEARQWACTRTTSAGLVTGGGVDGGLSVGIFFSPAWDLKTKTFGGGFQNVGSTFNDNLMADSVQLGGIAAVVVYNADELYRSSDFVQDVRKKLEGLSASKSVEQTAKEFAIEMLFNSLEGIKAFGLVVSSEIGTSPSTGSGGKRKRKVSAARDFVIHEKVFICSAKDKEEKWRWWDTWQGIGCLTLGSGLQYTDPNWYIGAANTIAEGYPIVEKYVARALGAEYKRAESNGKQIIWGMSKAERTDYVGETVAHVDPVLKAAESVVESVVPGGQKVSGVSNAIEGAIEEAASSSASSAEEAFDTIISCCNW